MDRPLTQNLYIYCLNNGVNLRDPSGNRSVDSIKSDVNRYKDQLASAKSTGAGQFVLDGIQQTIDSLNKELGNELSKPKPKPNPPTKPPKKPDWGDTSNPYNPVNNPNSAGSILSGADGYWSNGGVSSGGESETDISVPAITEWQRKLAEMYKNGQLGLMERAYFEKEIAPKINFQDNYYFKELFVGANTSGGRQNAEHRGTLSYDTQKFIYDLSQKTGVDYYLVLATILHESGCDPNANINAPSAAAGLMQITPYIWSHYAKDGGAYYNEYTYIRNFSDSQGADFTDRYDVKANIAVGVSLYTELQSNKVYGDDMMQVVQHYGEGSRIKGNANSTLFLYISSSSSEILYYRGSLMTEKGLEDNYNNIYYDSKGSSLVNTYDPKGIMYLPTGGKK